METVTDEGQKRGFERFLLFTDAVMAIAVTLLILPVVDEVVQLESRDRTVADILGDLRGELAGFLLSFTVILLLWMAHKQVFALVARPSSWLLRLNMLWLLSITLLPFTTALIADHGDEQATVLLYVGNVALSIYCLAGSTWILRRNPDLMLQGTSIADTDWLESVLNGVAITIALILAAVAPGLGFAVMLLMILPAPVQRMIQRRKPG